MEGEEPDSSDPPDMLVCPMGHLACPGVCPLACPDRGSPRGSLPKAGPPFGDFLHPFGSPKNKLLIYSKLILKLNLN